MDAISFQQPFATLVARGVKRLDIRKLKPGVTGRIAIHASDAVPTKQLMEEWMADREMALCFAEQGWTDREDLKKLPRKAIVGIGVPIEDVEVWRDAARRATTSGAVRAGSFANRPASRAVRSAPPRVVAPWHRTDLGPPRAPTGPDP